MSTLSTYRLTLAINFTALDDAEARLHWHHSRILSLADQALNLVTDRQVVVKLQKIEDGSQPRLIERVDL